MKLIMFRHPKPKGFNYKPIYYDPKKEEIEARRKELGLSDEGDEMAGFRLKMKRQWHRGRARNTKYSQTRTVLLVAISLLLIILIFFAKIF